MAANYTSNPAATQAPSPTPAANALPIISLPADTDGATWANLYQAFKSGIDFIGWISQVLGGTRTAKSLQVDATGGTVVAGMAGNVSGQTLTATQSIHDAGAILRGTVYKDNLPLALARVSGAGICTWGVNISGTTHVTTGIYDVTLLTPGTNSAQMMGVASSPNNVALANVVVTSTSVVRVLVCVASTGANVDAEFMLVVYGS